MTAVHPDETAHRSLPRPRNEIIEGQLAAIEAWHRARRARESVSDSVVMTREMRLDLSRRMAARRREQKAVIARADEHLRESGLVLGARGGIRAVIAHRNEWFRDKVATRLNEHGVVVVAAYEDGADASGAMVVEQAELLLVEDRLPTLPGVDVVRRVREFSPMTVVAAHVLDGNSVLPFADAGAHAVFTRRIPPVDIADELVACLGDGAPPRLRTLV